MFALARAHNVDALLAFRLRSRGVEDRLPDAVRKTANDARRRGMQSGLLVRETLTRLTTALQNGGVPVIVLKGAHLANVVYPDPSLRSMLDVDLLVDQKDLARAATLLRASGCRQAAVSDDDGPLPDFANHLPRFFQALPPAVELHWKLAANDPADRNDHWKRAVPVRLAGVDTLGLCPEDLLLLVCCSCVLFTPVRCSGSDRSATSPKSSGTSARRWCGPTSWSARASITAPQHRGTDRGCRRRRGAQV